MIARVAQFQGINAERAQATADEAAAVIGPLLEGLEGYQGSLELLSPDGNALSITLFDSEENARAAEQVFDEDMPRKLGETFKDWEGRRLSVEHFHVLADFSRLATV